MYRRSPHIVAYWNGKDLLLERFAPPPTTVSAAPITIKILSSFTQWRTAETFFRQLPEHSPESLRRVLDELVSHGFLERRNRSTPVKEDAMSYWNAWNPAAGLLHFSTKDELFDTDLTRVEEDLRRLAKRRPPPSPVKLYPKTYKVALPAPRTDAEFPRVLLARRTWRKFSSAPLNLSDLATLLGLTWGVQHWVESPVIGRQALKTSPSGGALQPIEAYVLAPRVSGLAPGLYHYAADGHGLELLRKGATAAQVERLLGKQWWFRSAAALVFMTAVFRRTQWKYESPRAYRVVLTEAGHLCQTFCLVATWLNLAPFCTLALADSQIEKELRIDGISESIVYAAGVGVRPRNRAWNPLSKPY